MNSVQIFDVLRQKSGEFHEADATSAVELCNELNIIATAWPRPHDPHFLVTFSNAEMFAAPAKVTTWEELTAWLRKYGETAKKFTYINLRDSKALPNLDVRTEVLYLYRGRCIGCGIEEWRYRKRLLMHRIVPGRQGGLFEVSNVVPTCASCRPKLAGLTPLQLKALRHPSTVEGGGDVAT